VCRLALAKYIIPLGWRFGIQLPTHSEDFPVVTAYAPDDPKYSQINERNGKWLPFTFSENYAKFCSSVTPSQQFFWLLYDVLDRHISIASTDLFKASQQAPMHGPLLAIRYLI